MPSDDFAVDAFITDNDIWRHYRDRDHEGILYDDQVALDTDVGPWPAGTPLRDVLIALWAWVEGQL